MKFTIDKQEKYVLIKLDEIKLDDIISPQLKTELERINSEGNRNIILDLSSIKESSDLSGLLLGTRICKDSNGLFVITGFSDKLSHLISISKLENAFTIVPKVSEAIDLIYMEEIEREFDQEPE